jgi:hypothetical protein
MCGCLWIAYSQSNDGGTDIRVVLYGTGKDEGAGLGGITLDFELILQFPKNRAILHHLPAQGLRMPSEALSIDQTDSKGKVLFVRAV